MVANDSQHEQYLICSKYKNHPKEDIEVCRKCELKKKCPVYQDYLQPGLPWVKGDSESSDESVTYSIQPLAICTRCRHYHGDSTCNAYPEKIPTEILLGYVFHTRSYKGDQGICFEPVDTEEK